MKNILISWRHIKKDKVNSLINIVGLGIALGIEAIVMTFLVNEHSFDRSYPNSKQIYRLVIDSIKVSNNSSAQTPYYFGKTISEQFNEVEDWTIQSLCMSAGTKMSVDKNKWIEVGENYLMGTSKSFFSVTGAKLLQGSIENFDDVDDQILLSHTFAKKLFGNDNPVGKMVYWSVSDEERPMTVGAVFADLPHNSTFTANVMVNAHNTAYVLMHDTRMGGFFSNGTDRIFNSPSSDNMHIFTNYFLLQKGTDIKALEEKITRHCQTLDSEFKPYLSLEPLTDVYHSKNSIRDNNCAQHSDDSMQKILLIVGLLILAVALVNYVNLALVQGFTRIRAHAVCKAYGALPRNLVWQNIAESVLTVVLSLPIALVSAGLMLPKASHWFGKEYELNFVTDLLPLVGEFAIATMVIGALVGLILSYKVNRFNLYEALKGRITENEKNRPLLNSILIGFQLSTFIAMLITISVILSQLDNAVNSDLGFKKECLMSLPCNSHYDEFRQEALALPNVVSVTKGLGIPPFRTSMSIRISNDEKPEEFITMQAITIGKDYVKTVGLKLLEGSDITDEINEGVILTQDAVRAIGMKDNAVGEMSPLGVPVVGIVENANFYSMHFEKKPTMLWYSETAFEIGVRINTENTTQTIEQLRDIWNRVCSPNSFDFKFTDDRLQKIYTEDISMSKMVGFMAGLTMVISLLGLIGFTTLQNQRRRKEIGIRKVNGATITDILAMLGKRYLVISLISFIVASIVAYKAVSVWLSQFAYHVDISAWLFIVVGMVSTIIVLATVAIQSLSVARRNPVDAIKTE